MRRRLPRLRQRWLARHPPPHRPPPRTPRPPAPPSASTATIATAPSPTSPTKSGLGRSVWATGITVADYDNDGFDDLFITCWGQNLLFHNNGDGTFTDVTEKAGLLRIRASRYGTGCTWIDYDRDGRLDLFVSHYLVFDPAKAAPRGKDPGCNYLGVPVFCGPAGLAAGELPPVSQQRRRHVHRREREVRHRRP